MVPRFDGPTPHGRADPVMHAAQDAVFDSDYWVPSVESCREMGLTLPLSYAVMYDTYIHSGPKGIGVIRQGFEQAPPAKGGMRRSSSILTSQPAENGSLLERTRK